MATTTTRVSVETLDTLRDAVLKAKGPRTPLAGEVDAAIMAHAERLLVEAETGAIQAPSLPDLTKPFLQAMTYLPAAKSSNVLISAVVYAGPGMGKTVAGKRLAKELVKAYAAAGNKDDGTLEVVVSDDVAAATKVVKEGKSKATLVVLDDILQEVNSRSSDLQQHLETMQEFSQAVEAFGKRRQGRVVVVIALTQSFKSLDKSLRGSFILYKETLDLHGVVDNRGRAYATTLMRRILVEHDYAAKSEWVVSMPGYHAGRVVLTE